jgi:hypothetical protein
LLFNKRSEPASVKSECVPQTLIGDAGWNSALPTTLTWTTLPGTESPTYKCSPDACGMDASRPAANPYDLTQFLNTYKTLGRRTQGWGPRTPDLTDTENSTTDSHTNCNDTPSKTHQHTG